MEFYLREVWKNRNYVKAAKPGVEGNCNSFDHN
jgi:hypothetical protein